MLAQQLAQQLRHDISDALYAPGEQLQEVHVASRYEVSRNTLREAFAVLAEKQLLERIPNRGVFIASPSIESVRDLYQARLALEPAALLWGAHRGPLSNLHNLRAIVDAATRASAKEVGGLNQKFHRELVSSLGSSLLDQTMDNLLARMRLCFIKVLETEPDFHTDYVTFNAHIVDLLEDGDGDVAALEMRQSLTETCERICTILDPN